MAKSDEYRMVVRRGPPPRSQTWRKKVCPGCESKRVGSFEPEEGQPWRTWYCKSCRHQWYHDGKPLKFVLETVKKAKTKKRACGG